MDLLSLESWGNNCRWTRQCFSSSLAFLPACHLVYTDCIMNEGECREVIAKNNCQRHKMYERIILWILRSISFSLFNQWYTCFRKIACNRTGETAQHIIVFAAMPDDLNSTPWTYMAEKGKLLQIVLWPAHMHLDTSTHMHTNAWINT